MNLTESQFRSVTGTSRRVAREAAVDEVHSIYSPAVARMEQRIADLEKALENEKNAARSAGAQFRSKIESLEYQFANAPVRMTYHDPRIDSHEKALMNHTKEISELQDARKTHAQRLNKQGETLSRHSGKIDGLRTSADYLLREDQMRRQGPYITSNPTGRNPNWIRDKWLSGDWGDYPTLEPRIYGTPFTVQEPGTPTGRAKPQPKNGDKLTDPYGEVKYFWWGQWRRESEIAGFSNWVTKKALGKK